MRNDEDKDSGAPQHKVWNPGRLYPKRYEDIEAYGQQQTNFWDLGGFRQHMKSHDYEVMNVFNFGSLVQEHWLSKIKLKVSCQT